MSELQGIARFRFHDGKVEEYKRLSARCMEIVRTKDTGTLQYEVYFNEDQSECIVLERYRDSEALIEHLANLGDTGATILATASVSANYLVSPAQNSGRTWRPARSASSRPSCPCRRRTPA
jgi:quinol monooxygenase YgiN